MNHRFAGIPVKVFATVKLVGFCAQQTTQIRGFQPVHIKNVSLLNTLNVIISH